MGTKSMWADVNTKPVQGGLYRIFRHQMIGVPIEYDDDVERRRTRPLLLPKVKAEGVSQGGCDLIEKIQVVAPTKNMPIYKSILEKGKNKAKVESLFHRDPRHRRNEGVFWGNPNMGLGLNPSGKRV